jgi:hypothetical protein
VHAGNRSRQVDKLMDGQSDRQIESDIQAMFLCPASVFGVREIRSKVRSFGTVVTATLG